MFIGLAMLIILSGVVGIFLLQCTDDWCFVFNWQKVRAELGTLDGTMTIGPICPVERIDQPCTPTPEMYAARKVFVYAKGKQTLLRTLTPDAEGKFHTTLPEGTYFVDMEHQGIGRTSGVPATVHIASGESATLAITVDTGIR